MPERLEPEKGRAEGPVFISAGEQGAAGAPPAYVPPSFRHAPRPVTQIFPPLVPPGAGTPAPPRRRSGGLRPGFRDVHPHALPEGYGDDRVVIMPRDPQWIFAYWEISDGLRQAVARLHGPQVWEHGRLVLRVYDVTGLRFDGTNAHRSWDVEVGAARNWYVHVGVPERDYCLDLGLSLPDGRFILLARSNTVRTPADGFSALTDAEWLTLDEIYRQSLGLERSDSSQALVKAVPRRLRELVSSPGVSSLMSPFGGAPGPRPFWLSVGAELVIYGGTEPGAALTVNGRPLALTPDGTFELRLAYPDGEFALPIVARSAHTGEERTVTLRFRRETAAPQ
ncbi:MAG TPA: DUF4912 domain-containing protein [Firmicutes bacterium]|nr:DUF4912 domain-containing protein [Bacillota bacterium]